MLFLGLTPTICPLICPSRNRMSVGIPRTPNCEAMSGLSSTFSLATRTFPPNSFATSSRIGAMTRHGPHQGAQKSTNTGVDPDSTVVLKFPLFSSSMVPAIGSSLPALSSRRRAGRSPVGERSLTAGRDRLVGSSSAFRELLLHAPVHHHGNPRCGEPGSGFLVHYTLLHPEVSCADPDRRLGDRGYRLRFPEHVDEIDAARNLRQGPVGFFAQGLADHGVHRNDPVPFPPEIARHDVARAVGLVREDRKSTRLNSSHRYISYA